MAAEALVLVRLDGNRIWSRSLPQSWTITLVEEAIAASANIDQSSIELVKSVHVGLPDSTTLQIVAQTGVITHRAAMTKENHRNRRHDVWQGRRSLIGSLNDKSRAQRPIVKT